ncbi:MAG: metallophosphoesterase, partial [Actinomycetota bacterium]
MARTRYIISDLHLGAGDYLDDFNQDASFEFFLESIARRRSSELIINGDFIDFVAVTLEEDTNRPFSRLGCTEDESLRKLERVLEAHPRVIASMREFIDRGHRVVLIPGNHDIDLFWPKVRDRLLEELGEPGSDNFHFESSGVYRKGGLHVEHGNQYFADSVFENFTNPFLRDPKTGELRLERCWGTAFMEYFANGHLAESNPFINNVRPIPNMVFMGVQDESWWFKLIYGYKIIRFLSRVGLPPFKQSRALLRKKREGRLDTEEYSRRKVVDLISGRARLNAPKVEEAERIEAGLPGEDDKMERGQDGLLLDSLATREDTLSV